MKGKSSERICDCAQSFHIACIPLLKATDNNSRTSKCLLYLDLSVAFKETSKLCTYPFERIK